MAVLCASAECLVPAKKGTAVKLKAVPTESGCLINVTSALSESESACFTEKTQTAAFRRIGQFGGDHHPTAAVVTATMMTVQMERTGEPPPE